VERAARCRGLDLCDSKLTCASQTFRWAKERRGEARCGHEIPISVSVSIFAYSPAWVGRAAHAPRCRRRPLRLCRDIASSPTRGIGFRLEDLASGMISRRSLSGSARVHRTPPRTRADAAHSSSVSPTAAPGVPYGSRLEGLAKLVTPELALKGHASHVATNAPNRLGGMHGSERTRAARRFSASRLVAEIFEDHRCKPGQRARSGVEGRLWWSSRRPVAQWIEQRFY
jgi:hypothetical protein